MPLEPLFWWMSPYRDSTYQWRFGYEKVRLVVLPEEEKRKYLEKQNESRKVVRRN